jgi:hypothetical protein
MSDDTLDNAVPSDHTTLLDVLDSWDESGFAEQFVVDDEARIACVSCATTSDASRFEVAHTRRLEGASDPDDLLAVYALRCPACGIGGTLVVGYGPNATDQDGDVLSVLRTAPSDAADPPAGGEKINDQYDDAERLSLDPSAPGAHLVDESLDPVEPNEPA